MMVLNVKTWFCPETNLSYKDVYETKTEKGTTIQSTIEYDVPVKIEIPKNAHYEAPKQALTPPIVAEKVEEAAKITPPIVAEKVQVAVKITPPIVAEKVQEAVKITPPIVAQKVQEATKITPPRVMVESAPIKDTSAIFASVDQNPEYKDGTAALYKYVNYNIRYPENARKAGISGTVLVNFVVEIDGGISNIQIKKSVDKDMDAEAKRLVQSMSGTWKAGKINGKDVRATYTLPLKFELGE